MCLINNSKEKEQHYINNYHIVIVVLEALFLYIPNVIWFQAFIQNARYAT